MDQYVAGDNVAVWRKDTGEVFFEKSEYVKLEAKEEFYCFDSGSLVMELSPEHRVPYFDSNGAFCVRKAAEIESRFDDISIICISSNDDQYLEKLSSKTTKITRFPSEDGFKYCFTTSTGFFVARCNGSIFVTGNSGKSSSCCVEIFKRALEQSPSQDGVRRSRWAAVRNTYGELKSTTIKTWEDWFRDIQMIKWDTPIVSTIKIPNIGDGTAVELEVLFLALDRPDDVGKLRSLELTGMWLNEASQLEKAVLDMATQRVGRYPSKHLHGGPSWTGVIMDTNPPDDDSWWYKLAVEEKPEGYEFFDQPGGLVQIKDKSSPDNGKYKPNPLAENVRNLVGGYDYYFKQLGGKSDDYIKVFILGEYGTTMDGKPVYPEFNEKIHVSKEPLNPIHNLPLVLAFDFGLTPACVFGQMSPKGQLLILDELVSEDMGIRQFYSECVLPHLNSKYRGMEVFGYGDPAGVGRSQADEKTCFQELALLGFVCEPADSNEFVARRESVAYFLQRLTSSGPGILLDPSCSTLIKGFRGGYRYERLKVSGSSRYKDRPVKDHYSHIADAMQYLCMSMRGDKRSVKAREIEMVAWS